ncbi:MAG TPA: sigma-70 family RNA polymerase sigma factor [Candidatus Saccharimonadales bacterium]|jgi:RNA polymerase sigma-70 factor (ECF subfamily)|nr:sigma-70 family RNA polymerase sigma factor [Candidatus Saccharimonadales bacterium]
MPKVNQDKKLQAGAATKAKVQAKVIEIFRPAGPVKAERHGGSEVYLSPNPVDFFLFDENYLRRLQEGDPHTVSHFFAYFTRLLRIKLKSRRLAPHTIDDIMQDTFMRALEKVKAHEVRDPSRLGAYINGICRNLIFEHFRSAAPYETLKDDFDVPDAIDLERVVQVNEIKKRVQQVLAKMPIRDREILRAIYLDERNKDEICREHDVDRGYLRVLLHRALKLFRDLYGKH